MSSSPVTSDTLYVSSSSNDVCHVILFTFSVCVLSKPAQLQLGATNRFMENPHHDQQYTEECTSRGNSCQHPCCCLDLPNLWREKRDQFGTLLWSHFAESEFKISARVREVSLLQDRFWPQDPWLLKLDPQSESSMLPHFANVCSCFGQRRLKPAPPRDGGETAAPPKEEVDGCTTAREEEKQDRSKGRQGQQPRFFFLQVDVCQSWNCVLLWEQIVFWSELSLGPFTLPRFWSSCSETHLVPLEHVEGQQLAVSSFPATSVSH